MRKVYFVARVKARKSDRRVDSTRNQSKKNARRLLIAASVGALAILARKQAYGNVPISWTGGGTDNLWSTAANWDVTPSNGNDITFSGTTRTTNVNSVSNTSSNLLSSVNSITFDATAGAFTVNAAINATALSIGDGGITNNSSAAQTFHEDIAVAATEAETWATGSTTSATMSYGNVSLGGSGASLTLSGSAGHTFTGNLVLTGDNTIVAGNTGANVTIEGITGGSGTLALVASNTGFNLNGNVNYSGQISITATGNALTNGIGVGLSASGNIANMTIDIGDNSETDINNATQFSSTSNLVINSGTIRTSGNAMTLHSLSLGNIEQLIPGANITTDILSLSGGSINNRTYGLMGSGNSGSQLLITGGFGTHNGDYIGGSFANGATISNGGGLYMVGTTNNPFVAAAGLTITSGGTIVPTNNSSLTGAQKIVVGISLGDSASFNAGGMTQSYLMTSGQTLAGFATVDGPSTSALVIVNGSSLAPGNNSAGALTLTGNLSVAGGATLANTLDGTQAGSQTNISGELITSGISSGNKVNLILSNAANGTYDILTYSSTDLTPGDITADFSISGLSGYQSATIDATASTDGAVEVTVVPEPASLSLLGFGIIGLFGRRRKRRERQPG